jgi:hypothetical protein
VDVSLSNPLEHTKVMIANLQNIKMINMLKQPAFMMLTRGDQSDSEITSATHKRRQAAGLAQANWDSGVDQSNSN